MTGSFPDAAQPHPMNIADGMPNRVTDHSHVQICYPSSFAALTIGRRGWRACPRDLAYRPFPPDLGRGMGHRRRQSSDGGDHDLSRSGL